MIRDMNQVLLKISKANLTLLSDLIIIFSIFIRGSVPRIRTDQILELGWKKLLPLSLINILIVIFMVEIYPYFIEIVSLPEVF